MRHLAAGLTRAITVREAIDEVEGRAAAAVGADRCVVVGPVGSTLTTREAKLRSDPPLSPTIAEAIGSGSPQSTPHMSVYPIAIADGSQGALVFEWVTSGERDEEFVGEVASLCLAALTRAWATRRARELGAVMDSLLEQAPIGFAFIDPQLRYVRLNQRLAEINGLSVAEHRGRSIREVVPDLADELEPILRDVIASGDPTPRIEIAGVTPADPGDHRVFGAVYLPVTIDDEVVGITAVVDDITDQKRRVDELERQYRHERDIAVRLQEGLTPRNLPRPADYDIAARYIAGSRGLRIGGDWYDLIELKPDLYAFAIGDVVGHGMAAALAMVQIRHALAGLCHAVARPVEVLERLDQYATEYEDRYIATLVYGLLEPSTGTLEFSSAGHPPPLIIDASGDARLINEGRGTPIGVTAGTRDAAIVRLETGDTLLLYTDGVFEERGVSVDVGIERLSDTVARPFRSAGDVVDAVVGAVPTQEHIDDIALLVVRRDA